MHQNHLEGLLKFKLLGPSPRVSDSVGLGGGCLVSKLCLTFVTPWTVVHRLLCPWDFPDENTGVGSHFLLQGLFLTQGSNLDLLHCRWILYHLSYQGNPL